MREETKRAEPRKYPNLKESEGWEEEPVKKTGKSEEKPASNGVRKEVVLWSFMLH